ncbi:MAG TPA: putative Fe-S cluster assembly protein SufT [Chthoniobacterales bacterium]
MIDSNTEILLSRDTKAIRIPSGEVFTLPEGSRVFITQSLGGTYTVASEYGLARISDKDADALGIDLSAPTHSDSATAATSATAADIDPEEIWERLRTVYDPEIPVNIVDLGLVYDCQIVETAEKKTRVEVKMTLTAPGCGMGPTIAADARSKVLTVPGVDDAEVELVWDPPWNQHMISEIGKMKLGMI